MRPILILLCPPLVISCLFIIGSAAPHGAESSARGFAQIGEPYREPLFSEVVEKFRRREKLPRGLIEATAHVESKFREDAFNAEKGSRCYRRARTAVERRRCSSSGLMQTVEYWHGPARNWIESLDKGSRKLGACYRKHRNIRRAAACYNGTGAAAEIYAQKVVSEFAIWKKLT